MERNEFSDTMKNHECLHFSSRVLWPRYPRKSDRSDLRMIVILSLRTYTEVRMMCYDDMWEKFGEMWNWNE